jgi:nicotinate-nucleotide pyrophosphorylase (carboxylating)
VKGGNIVRKNIQKNKEMRQFHKIVKAALKEDIGRGDITTDTIVQEDIRTLGIVFPREDGILCGVDLAKMVFEEIDERIDFQKMMHDGDTFSTGMTLATVTGPARACLKGERTALNFLQHLSGIASLTKRFVSATGGRIKILDTRKTLPGLRILEKYAVRVGGGYNHRFGLYDMVLIKDNHIEIAGGITNAVTAVRAKKKRAFIEVEVRTFDELQEAIGLKVNRVMLDNMNVQQIQRCVETVQKSSTKIEIEISGGVNISNVEEFANCGADFISVGALTHSARAIDIALKLKMLGECES